MLHALALNCGKFYFPESNSSAF